jgi:hypothetical protein
MLVTGLYQQGRCIPCGCSIAVGFIRAEVCPLCLCSARLFGSYRTRRIGMVVGWQRGHSSFRLLVIGMYQQEADVDLVFALTLVHFVFALRVQRVWLVHRGRDASTWW